jgi:hypothetical protein
MATIAHEGRVYVTSDARAHFYQQELGGVAHAFGVGDLRALVICQWWMDGECANAWHIETAEQRLAMIAKLEEMIALLREPGTES